MAAVAPGVLVGGVLASRAAERLGQRNVVIAGLAIVAASTWTFGIDRWMSVPALAALARCGFGIGFSLAVATTTEAVVASVASDRVGIGAAVRDTLRQAGGALGVAVIGSVQALAYRSALAGASVPGPSRSEVHDSIGQALVAAASLPSPEASTVRRAAVDAFTTSVSIAVRVGCVALLAGVVVAWRWLPCRPGTSGTLDDPSRPSL